MPPPPFITAQDAKVQAQAQAAEIVAPVAKAAKDAAAVHDTAQAAKDAKAQDAAKDAAVHDTAQARRTARKATAQARRTPPHVLPTCVRLYCVHTLAYV